MLPNILLSLPMMSPALNKIKTRGRMIMIMIMIMIKGKTKADYIPVLAICYKCYCNPLCVH